MSEKISQRDEEISNYLYIDYSINYFATLIKEINQKDDEYKIDSVKVISLFNLFLLRRLMDPGLNNHVLRELLEDQELLSVLESYFKNIGSGMDENIERVVFNTSHFRVLDRSHIREQPRRFEPPRFLESIGDLIGRDLHNMQSISEYLFMRGQKAEEHNDIFTQRAIAYLLNEQNGHDILPLFMAIIPFNYKFKRNPLFYRHLEMRFLVENIMYMSQMESAPSIPHFLEGVQIQLQRKLGDSFNLITADLTEKFIRTLLKDIIDVDDPETLMVNGKFITDTISIASVVWFNNHTIEKRIGILNAYYPEDHEMVEGALLGIGPEQLTSLASLLQYHGDLNSAERILNHLLEDLKMDELMRYVNADNLATINRDKRDFDGALEHYRMALQIAEGSSFDDKDYKVVIESKNIFETYLKMGDMEAADGWLERIEASMSRLSECDRAHALLNMAQAYRRSRDYDKELSTWDRLMAIDNVHEYFDTDQFISINNRLTTLNIAEDFDRLRKHEVQEDFDEAIHRAKMEREMFQFDKAMNWYEVAGSLIPDTTVQLVGMAKTTYLKKDLGRSKEHSRRLKGIRPNMIGPGIHLGLLELKDGDNRDGTTHIVEDLDCVYRTSDKDVVYFYMKELIRGSVTLGLYSPELMDKLYEGMTPDVGRARFLHDLGNVMLSLGFIESSMAFMKQSLENDPGPELQEMISKAIAENMIILGEYIEAIGLFKGFIGEDPNDDISLANLSSCYLSIGLRRKGMEHIERAISLKDDPKHRVMKDAFKNSIPIIALGLVACPSSKDFLYSAEKQFFDNLRTGNTDIDLSNLMVEYFKGIETMLYSEVADGAFLDSLHGPEVRPSSGQRQVPDELWWGDPVKALARLPGYLMNLKREKSMSFGTWIKVLEVGPLSTNKLERSFLSLIEQRIPHRERNTLIEVLKGVIDIRNASAHMGDIRLEELKDVRKGLIEKINDIIYIIDGRGL